MNQAEKIKNSAIEIKNLFNNKSLSGQTTQTQTENVQAETVETTAQ